VREIVALQLLQMTDPRFSLVTVTSASISPDLRNAKVYWSVVGGKERTEEVREAFRHAEHIFRRALAKELSVRFVPEIRFYYDDTADTAATVDALLKRIATDNSEEVP